MSQLFVRTGIDFNSCQQVLAHIGEEMLAKGVVHESYPQALVERDRDRAGTPCRRHSALRSHSC